MSSLDCFFFKSLAFISICVEEAFVSVPRLASVVDLIDGVFDWSMNCMTSSLFIFQIDNVSSHIPFPSLAEYSKHPLLCHTQARRIVKDALVRAKL